MGNQVTEESREITGLIAREYFEILRLYERWEIAHAANDRDGKKVVEEQIAQHASRIESSIAGFEEEEKTRLRGAGCFGGLFRFAKEISKKAKPGKTGYLLAVADAIHHQNLVGPISREEVMDCKRRGIPIIAAEWAGFLPGDSEGEKFYKPFSPEKRVIRIFFGFMRIAWARIREEEYRAEETRRIRIIRESRPWRFFRKLQGTLAFRMSADNRASGFVELVGNGKQVKVIISEPFPDLQGMTFRRGKIPDRLFAAIRTTTVKNGTSHAGNVRDQEKSGSKPLLRLVHGERRSKAA